MNGGVQDVNLLLRLQSDITENATKTDRILSDISKLSEIVQEQVILVREYNFILNEHHNRSTTLTEFVNVLKTEIEKTRSEQAKLLGEVKKVKEDSERQAGKLAKVLKIYNFFAFLPSVIKYGTVIAVAIAGTYTFMVYLSKLHGG